MLENFYCDKTKPDPKFKGFQTHKRLIRKEMRQYHNVKVLCIHKNLISNNISDYFDGKKFKVDFFVAI